NTNNNNNNNNVHQHLHSPTKLTEFARNFEEKQESLFGRVVNKLQNVYNQSYNTVNDISSHQVGKSMFYAEKKSQEENPAREVSTSSSTSLNVKRPSTLQLRTESETASTSSSSNATVTVADTEVNEVFTDLPPERSVSNVLKHLSSIVAAKHNNDLRNYKETELQRLWMPDSKAKECYDCAQKFSTFRRKHHCRLCGQIFCAKCCNQVLPGSIIRCEGDLKVCNYCSKIVLSSLKHSGTNMDEQMQALQQHLNQKLQLEEQPPLPPAVKRKTSLGYQEERFSSQPNYTMLSLDDRKNILQQSNSLIMLHEEMQRELPQQVCGQALIEFLNNNNKSANELQAVAILNALLAAGFLEPIVPDADQTEFVPSLHYRFKHSEQSSLSTQFETNSAEPQPPKSLDVSPPELGALSDKCYTSASTKLLESYLDHEEQLLAQLLRAQRLDAQAWGKVLQTLCSTAANNFKPEYCSNDLMDIRNYVNFKKVPGGRRKDSILVHGVAFSKNVAHKDMATHVAFPRILLLQCPIVYERIEGKFVTIETVLLQEQEYLRNVCARIMKFEPNVVLVHKNVAGIAQDLLRSYGVTLVLDVKLSVMERLARSLQCDIVSSIESNITMPKLGLCNNFYIKNYACGKTLMFFEKLSSPRGYTCLLRGGSNAELARAKQVAQALLFARYNWRLEMSFLLDEFAQPLSPKPSIFDSKEASPQTDDSEPQLRKRAPTERDKFQAAVSQNVSDFTDPLRSSDNAASYVPIETLAVEPRYDNRFRNALSSTLLSVSPHLSFPLPYLETEQGRNCKLRKLFPAELYFSKLWSGSVAAEQRPDSLEPSSSTELVGKENEHQQQVLLPPHDFVQMKLTAAANSRDIQTKLAEFRAFGGRLPKGKFPILRQRRRKAETIQRPQRVTEEQLYRDALDPLNHQRLPVLFCSFYYNPKAASSFCKLPMLLDMKFYGQHDIMLEQFLQRYCCLFNSMCPSCHLPVLGHVRRYVHSLGCVNVYLTEDQTRSDPKRIYFTSWCSICNATTPAVPLSDAAKCLSLAKYLELRFHGHAYKSARRPSTEMEQNSVCEHSLHRDYVHHFSFRGVGAKFQYTPVEVWETELPSLQLQLEQPKPVIGLQVQEEIKSFSIRGHEVYTRIHERIADLATEEEHSPLVSSLKAKMTKDQFMFKQKVEIVHTLLTEQHVNSYDIADALVMAKRALAESIEAWGPRLHEVEQLALKQAKQSHHVDAGTICTEELQPEAAQSDIATTNEPAPDAEEKQLNIDQMIASTVNSSTADKKSIKSRLLNLRQPAPSQAHALPTPLAAQEHATLPLGLIPVLVREQDLSSVIAYALTSLDYQRAIAALNAGEAPAVDANSSPLPRHKQALDSDAEEPVADAEASKSKAQPCAHVNLSFSSSSIAGGTGACQFQCEIYFAREFDALRAKCLSPPKLNRGLLRRLEQSKQCEELRISQGRSGGSEYELICRPKEAAQELQPDAEEEARIALARSLCTSVQWEARGGKSGSRFCKTLDDRFVLKEMHKKESDIFDSFAPEYFDYLSKCQQQQQQPTLLAKIFGVFKVTIKKKDYTVQKSLLVMENLFYGRDISNKFDLKGSERNRLVDPTNQNGEIVLLDENLVQMSWSNPLYVLSHSKAVLRDAIQRDASFLERNAVMDYSLLVGLDTKSNMLVLGIIDYLRTYTLEKKMESLIKQSGLLGGGMGKMPTVVSPQRYRPRFVEAMDRYFNTVPDRWEGLSKI
ncbi:fab1, partial [Drosophila busckii]